MYSIIIPHKNSAQLVHRLLQSIPKRTDLEVIVVDDTSDSSEIQKLEEIRNDYYFDFYHNRGKKGAGASRNVGLSHARGKYIIFADSDDFFCEDFENELDLVSQKDVDLIFYNVHSADSETYEESHRHIFFNDLVNSYLTDGKRDVLYKYSVPWGKIYRRSFLEAFNIKFAEVIAGNDMWFSCSCGVFVKSFEVSQTVLYTVTVREGSIVNTIKPEYFLSRFDETIRVNNMLRANKLAPYQYSVLYFLANAKKFGATSYVVKQILKNRSNVLIGLEKILSYKKVLVDRENRRKSN